MHKVIRYAVIIIGSAYIIFVLFLAFTVKKSLCLGQLTIPESSLQA